MKPLPIATAIALLLLQPASAADLIQPPPDASAQVEADPAPPVEQHGIWAAIAFSKIDRKHGFFWGADKRAEAGANALRHCERAGGSACSVVTTFRNHRHWDDNDGSGFPYNACGALAVSKISPAGISIWGATSAPNRKEAENLSLQKCEASGTQCEIREWVCT
ncbi:DUF4189 domain-containing protein [Agrobacterium sp. LMR679]|uniref:DUF4189 domain-containing protein n=1 Tax=Agrobacterium sp. LMR679 TaxID=3014335 RepID=UPI003FA4C46D